VYEASLAIFLLGQVTGTLLSLLVMYSLPIALAAILIGGIVVMEVRGDRANRKAAAARKDTAMSEPANLSALAARLREVDIFEGLTDHELRLVAGIGERRLIPAGDRLALAGSRGADVFTVLEGQLRCLTRNGDGEHSVRIAHENETVPLAALLDPPVLVTTIEAATDTEVFAIPRARLIELCDLQPMIGLQVYRSAAKAFERRYRKTLDGLVTSLRSALDMAGVPTGSGF
jgi:hypothetical protein